MQHVNYQKELDKFIGSLVKQGIRPRLLLHSCCAPCSSYVIEYLSEYFELGLYFYNPNMDTADEYVRRADELKRLVKDMGLSQEDTGIYRDHGTGARTYAENGIPAGGGSCACDRRAVRVTVADYDPESFLKIARGHEEDPERGTRCRLCYELRLRRTARYMKEYNALHPEAPYDYFATTLTLSPLKDACALNEIAERVAEESGLKCLKTDFKKRDGYKRSIELSREYGLYRQDYCGCRFSRRKKDT